jgi:mitochondrial import inner membrane translocase subunit TIM50
MNHNILK